MTENKSAVDGGQAAAPVVVEDGVETRIAELEAQNAKLIEESANYKLGMLKAKGKASHENLAPEDETPEELARRVAREELANSQIARNNAERDSLLTKALKENKELKLANANKTTVAAAVGSHNESTAVTDTSVTPEQEKAFRARGWNDKDIERYKKNLKVHGGR